MSRVPPQPAQLPQSSVPGPDAEHVDQASRIVWEHHPTALGAVLGGSGACGRAGPDSDLDITVLLPDGDTSRRELIRHEGRLAEMFLSTRTQLRQAFTQSRVTRRATALFLFADSVLLHDPEGHAETLRSEASALLAAGPDPLTDDEREFGRFQLTDLLDDLTESHPDTDRHEELAVADRLLNQAALYLTAHHRAWSGAGKWLPRRLLTADPVLGQELLGGHLALAERADPAPLAAAVHHVLEMLGGPLREGYVQVYRQAAG